MFSFYLLTFRLKKNKEVLLPLNNNSVLVALVKSINQSYIYFSVIIELAKIKVPNKIFFKLKIDKYLN